MPNALSTDTRTEYWRQQIEAWQSSGQSQRAYCKANALNYPQFIYWRRKFEALDAPDQRKPASDFVPVAWSAPALTSALSVVLPSGLELRGISADNLSLVHQLLSRLA